MSGELEGQSFIHGTRGQHPWNFITFPKTRTIAPINDAEEGEMDRILRGQVPGQFRQNRKGLNQRVAFHAKDDSSFNAAVQKLIDAGLTNHTA